MFTDAFVKIAGNELLSTFISSLNPYYDGDGRIGESFFDLKREELLLILLQSRPELSGLFFDYGIPGKIDLEQFMNRNYRFNVNLARFAFLRGEVFHPLNGILNKPIMIPHIAGYQRNG